MIVIDQAMIPGVHWKKIQHSRLRNGERGSTHRDQDEIILRNHHIRRQIRQIFHPLLPLEHQLLDPLRRSKVIHCLLLAIFSLLHVRTRE